MKQIQTSTRSDRAGYCVHTRKKRQEPCFKGGRMVLSLIAPSSDKQKDHTTKNDFNINLVKIPDYSPWFLSKNGKL